MIGVEQDCDVDASSANVHGPNKIPTSNSQEVHRTTASANNTPEHNPKRARLGPENTTPHITTNGFVSKNSEKTTNVGWPFRPDLMQLFRSTFDGRFKNSLEQNLSSYVARLSSTEDTLTTLKTEFKEITERMDCIEKASKDLKQIIIERVTLPAPTAGVGQKRTLSSQAPRLPPASTTVSTADKVTESSSAGQQLAISTSQSNVPTPSPTTCSSAATTSQSPFPVAFNSSPVTPNPRPLLPMIPMKSNTLVQQSPSVRAPLNVRPMDTIDLTSEGSPTVEEPIPQPKKVTDATVALPHMAESTPMLPPAFTTLTQATRPFAHHNPINPAPIVPPNNPRVTWFSPPQFPPVGKNPRLPSFSPRQMSFRELQRLPVAPLPPIPLQTALPTPVQPMPQLTIAEAAEGVCLQWTVAVRSMLFEQATAYEIYSYASSEVTLETLCTCLPWKKVGDVAALPLPMACTLTHVQPNNLYYFIVRSVDRFRRYSAWSNVVNAYVG